MMGCCVLLCVFVVVLQCLCCVVAFMCSVLFVELCLCVCVFVLVLFWWLRDLLCWCAVCGDAVVCFEFGLMCVGLMCV